MNILCQLFERNNLIATVYQVQKQALGMVIERAYLPRVVKAA